MHSVSRVMLNAINSIWDIIAHKMTLNVGKIRQSLVLTVNGMIGTVPPKIHTFLYGVKKKRDSNA